MPAAGFRWNRAVVERNWWQNVMKTDTCWIWIGPVEHTGYGRCTRTLTGERKAHRASWVIHHGLIPEGMVLDHTCRVKACVNPEHLEVVTTAENNRRTIPFNTKRAKTHPCPVCGTPTSGKRVRCSVACFEQVRSQVAATGWARRKAKV